MKLFLKGDEYKSSNPIITKANPTIIGLGKKQMFSHPLKISSILTNRQLCTRHVVGDVVPTVIVMVILSQFMMGIFAAFTSKQDGTIIAAYQQRIENKIKLMPTSIRSFSLLLEVASIFQIVFIFEVVFTFNVSICYVNINFEVILILQVFFIFLRPPSFLRFSSFLRLS